MEDRSAMPRDYPRVRIEFEMKGDPVRPDLKDGEVEDRIRLQFAQEWGDVIGDGEVLVELL